MNATKSKLSMKITNNQRNMLHEIIPSLRKSAPLSQPPTQFRKTSSTDGSQKYHRNNSRNRVQLNIFHRLENLFSVCAKKHNNLLALKIISDVCVIIFLDFLSAHLCVSGRHSSVDKPNILILFCFLLTFSSSPGTYGRASDAKAA